MSSEKEPVFSFVTMLLAASQSIFFFKSLFSLRSRRIFTMSHKECLTCSGVEV